MNAPRGPEISGWIITTSLEELAPKSLSHGGIFPHWDVWENVRRVETQYTARRTRPCITGRRSYQFPHVNGVGSPSHLLLHLLNPCHALEERQWKMTPARWEIIFLAIQTENPLPFSGQQLVISIWRCIPEHKTRLPIDSLVTILEESSS